MALGRFHVVNFHKLSLPKLAIRQATSLWRHLWRFVPSLWRHVVWHSRVISNVKNYRIALAEKPQDGAIVSDAYKIKSKLTHQKAGRKPQITRFSGQFIKIKRNLSF
jgi:hypothetical protein